MEPPRLGHLKSQYVLITPVKDEERYVRETLMSVAAQTIGPQMWILVDDGSCDSTPKILNEFAQKNSWVKVIAMQSGQERVPGAAVVSAFKAAYAMLQTMSLEYEFIVKLDGDLRFDSDYFESLLAEFRDDKTLGIAGGLIYEVAFGGLVARRTAPGDVRGATKVYRRTCFEQIGGLMPVAG